MAVQPRGIIFADDRASGFTQLLRQFLFKIGFGKTIVTNNLLEVSNLIHTNNWPIIFIDHTDGVSDAMQIFETIYKPLGHQMLPYVFTASADNHLFEEFTQSIGAVELLKKPLQPNLAEKIVKSVIPQQNDPAMMLAHRVSRALLQGQYTGVEAQLTRLREVPQYKRHAEIALLKLEINQGLMSKAHERFSKLLRDKPNDLRVLSEYAHFLKTNSLFARAIKCYQRIQSLHPELTFKLWDQISLHIELEQIDEAAHLLACLYNNQTHKDASTEALARLMYCMGLQNNIQQLVKQHPNAKRNFNEANSTKKVGS